MVVGTEQLRAFQRNGAITERGSFRAAGDNADVLRHEVRVRIVESALPFFNGVVGKNGSVYNCSYGNTGVIEQE